MSKYESITRYLVSLEINYWVASFAELEALLEAPLPYSAYHYPAWWSNQGSGGHSQSRAWQDAGWRTTKLDLEKRSVTFVRELPRSIAKATSAESYEDGKKAVSTAAPAASAEGISIAEAKARLAAYLGVSQEKIEITIHG
ncbi:hypothetical protein [Methylosinus sporium]|uniref:DUF7662 domain-containing protein n=1 Tax=Methylosinus sporium TaxID=428 RepID=UPI00383A8B35